MLLNVGCELEREREGAGAGEGGSKERRNECKCQSNLSSNAIWIGFLSEQDKDDHG